MSMVRRYTADEMRDMARKIHARNDLPVDRAANAKMLRQSAETEARVVGLVDHLEKMIFFAELYDLKNSFDEEEIRLAREALSKFRGGDNGSL